MKKGCLISLGAFLVLLLVAAGSLVYLAARTRAPSLEKGSFVEIAIGGSIPENITEESFFGADPMTMRDISDILHWAGEDPRVTGIVLRIEPMGVGWGKLQEIRDQVEAVKARGKTVIAFLEAGDDSEYYLASAADKIFMPPMGFLAVDGLSMEMQFFRGTLDKVGVEYDGVAIGEFKSAPEHYTRTKMSDHYREEYEALLDGSYSGYVAAVASSRKIPDEKVRELVDAGPYQAVTAKEKGLIDETYYWDEFEEWVKGSSSKKPKIVDARKIRGMAAKKREPGALSRQNVAVIYATGQIMSGQSQAGGFGGEVMGSETIVEALRDAREDDSIKAVVLRIDSPGGSVIASDVIWREVMVTKSKKPVIVSMSDLAASGGYYIAMGASAIVAQPGTITGSIGIFTGKFVTSGLEEKVGVTTDRIKRGTYSDMFSSGRKFTDVEREKIKVELTDSYQVFIQKVADGRGLDVATVDKVARGRVWLGNAGKELGLVDELGGLDKAIDVAKQKASLTGDVGLVILPRKRSFWDQIGDGRGLVNVKAPQMTIPAPLVETVQQAEAMSRIRDGERMVLLPHSLTIE